MHNYLWSPKWFENITTVHLSRSHLTSKVTKQFVLYIFNIWSLSFCHQLLCSKTNCTKIILRSQGDTALFTAGHQQRVTVRRCISSWSCYPPCLMCTDLKIKFFFPWNVSVTLQHLVLQLSDILTCIYQVMQWAHFDSSAICRIPPPPSPYPTPVTPFPSCRSALFTTVLIVSP